MAVSATSTFFKVKMDALPGPETFPQADVVVLKEAVEITLYPDGRTRETHRCAWRILSPFAREKLSDVTVRYESEHQTVEVHRAECHMRDGKVMETPGYAFNEIVPFALDRAPDWASFRELVVSLVGAETGAVCVLEYTVDDREPWKGFFWGETPMGGPHPVLEKVLEVKVPKGTALAWACRNKEQAPEIGASGGFDVYRWTAKDHPAFDPEDSPAGADRWVPAVVFSTAGSWPEVTGKLAGRVSDASVSHPSLKKRASEKTEGDLPALEKALKLHEFVFKGVRTLDFHASDTDFSFRPASKVLESAYGHALEKGVLLAALAKEAGLGARVFLGMPDFRGVEGAVFPGRDAETWVEIVAGKLRLYLRPDNAAHEANDAHLEETILVPLSEAGSPGSIRVQNPASACTVRADLTLKEDLSLEGKVRLEFRGGFNPYTRLLLDGKTTLDAFAGECASKLFKGKAEEARADTLALERTGLSFTLKGAKARRVEAFVALEVPDVPKSLLGFAPPVHRSARSTTWPLASTASVDIEMEVATPKDARVRIGADNLKRRGPAASITASFEEKEKSVRVETRWRFPRKLVHPEDYGKFRRALTSIANPQARTILFEGFRD